MTKPVLQIHMIIRYILTAIFALVAMGAYAQFGVGVRDNRFVYGDFTFLKHYEVKLEQSVFSEKIGYQYIRVYAGYKGAFKGLEYKGQAYFGTTYNGDYQSAGALLQLRYTFIGRIFVDGKLNPHYDTGFGYKTAWYGGAGVKITKNIDILAAYTTIPEYRMTEKRVRAGFDFHVKKLSVSPCLSVAVGGTSKAKTLRALMNFRYQF